MLVVGSFLGSLNVGTGTLTASSFDMFAVSLSLAGANNWARSYGGPETDVPSGVAIDSDGNVSIAGRFRGTADYGGGPLVSAAGSFDVVLFKVSGSNGNHLLSRRFGSTGFDQPGYVAVDSANNTVVLQTS